jgi:hypothetical protein
MNARLESARSDHGYPWLSLAFAGIVVAFAAVVIARPDKFFADDSYFYFQVAWNFARGVGSTFNNILPTNGYHPLWMLLCAAVFKIFPARTVAVHGIAFLLSVFDAIAFCFLALLLRRSGDQLWPVALFFYVPFCFLTQLGTEGALSGCMLALLTWSAWEMAERPSSSMAVVFSFAVALAVLARLDNIFIVACIWFSLYLASGPGILSASRRSLLLTATIPATLWGVYVWTNWHFFHTIQPISGLLKSSSDLNHRLGSNFPHIAEGSFLIIIVGTITLAVTRNDRFFRVIELPFTIGVLCHASYIFFRMSSETRWTWYYTSWVLLAGILAARVLDRWVRGHLRLLQIVRWGSVLLLVLVWIRCDLFGFMRMADSGRSFDFQHAVYERAGMRRVIVFDKPGRIAYYSDVKIVPLDGLMGNLEFQNELATRGIAEFVSANHIDGFVGPPVPLDSRNAALLCGSVWLASSELQCSHNRNGENQVNAVLVFARIPPTFAGRLSLSPDQLVWSKPADVAVWRLR